LAAIAKDANVNSDMLHNEGYSARGTHQLQFQSFARDFICSAVRCTVTGHRIRAPRARNAAVLGRFANIHRRMAYYQKQTISAVGIVRPGLQRPFGITGGCARKKRSSCACDCPQSMLQRQKTRDGPASAARNDCMNLGASYLWGDGEHGLEAVADVSRTWTSQTPFMQRFARCGLSG